MKLERRYAIPEDEARARLVALTDYWSKKHGIEAKWAGNDVTLRGKVLGVRFDGTVKVGAGQILADVNTGLLAERLGGRRYVESKLDDYLDPAVSLESLRARVPA
ncbi:MAG: polyhydroxyalkanoic acid system family protein [Polyangiaceae bacterium]|nr:polyhydroxyalkanoic acid system family protein [Polyangiaceae bacterium]